MKTDIVVIGAGLTGLTTAYQLARKGRQVNNLKYAPVVEVSVGVKDTLGGDYQAFGGLVPGCEQKQVLGILFPSACFTGRAPEGGAHRIKQATDIANTL